MTACGSLFVFGSSGFSLLCLGRVFVVQNSSSGGDTEVKPASDPQPAEYVVQEDLLNEGV